MKTRTTPRCSGCKKRIPRSEPDLILRRMDPKKPTRTALRLAYHERCKEALVERISSTPAALWCLTRRTVNAEAN